MDERNLINLLILYVEKSYFDFVNSEYYRHHLLMNYTHSCLIEYWANEIRVYINDFVDNNFLDIDIEFYDYSELVDKINILKNEFLI